MFLFLKGRTVILHNSYVTIFASDVWHCGKVSQMSTCYWVSCKCCTNLKLEGISILKDMLKKKDGTSHPQRTGQICMGVL